MSCRFLILSVFIVLLSTSGIGQTSSADVSIEWGDDIKRDKKVLMSGIVADDESGFYVLETKVGGLLKSGKLVMAKYDYSMKRLLSNELVMEYQGKPLSFESILDLDGVLYLFTTFINRDTKKNYLFYQKINKSSLTLEGEIQPIAEIAYGGSKGGTRNSGTFELISSRNDSSLMVFTNLPFEKKENERFQYKVYNKRMELQSEDEIQLDYQDELFSIYDYDVADNGEVYVLGKVYKGKVKEELKGVANYSFSILKYSNENKEPKEYQVKGGNKFLTDFKLEIDDQNDLICAGFFSNKSINEVGGTFYTKIDGKTGEVKSQTFYDFELDFITLNFTAKQERKAKKKTDKGKDVELFKYDLDDIIMREDGGACLVGEQYYIRVVSTTHMSNGQATTRTTYHYHYNDIIVINFSPEGEVEWVDKIAKRQHTVNDQGFFSSYALMIDEDKLRFIFNDNGKNMMYKEGGQLANFRKKVDESLVMMVSIDMDGRKKRESLFSGMKTGVLTRPKVSQQISDKEMIVYGMWKKSYKFAKLTF